jgi:hypothetical protein
MCKGDRGDGVRARAPRLGDERAAARVEVREARAVGNEPSDALKGEMPHLRHRERLDVAQHPCQQRDTDVSETAAARQLRQAVQRCTERAVGAMRAAAKRCHIELSRAHALDRRRRCSAHRGRLDLERADEREPLPKARPGLQWCADQAQRAGLPDAWMRDRSAHLRARAREHAHVRYVEPQQDLDYHLLGQRPN